MVLTYFAGAQFSAFKEALTELAVEVLGPIGEAMTELKEDTALVDAILKDGTERAGAIAEKHLAEIRDLMGLVRY